MGDIRSLYNSNSKSEQLKRVREFLAAEDPNHQIIFGFTLLHAAIMSNFDDNVEVIEEFIKAGADVNLGTHLDCTPLHVAVGLQKIRVVDALLRHGAAINAKDYEGRPVLHYAVTKRNVLLNNVSFKTEPKPRIIQQLLRHQDVDCNAVDRYGDTPLMMAIKDKEFRAVKLLLRHGANPNICNKLSETPLHVAFAMKPNFAECHLILAGASITSADKSGLTPLDIFIQNRIRKNQSTSKLPDTKCLVLKIIALQCNITEMIMQKLNRFPELNQLLHRCSKEVLQMRGDFLSHKLTVHDFLLKCWNENQFQNPLLQIYQPVVERIIRGDYNEYCRVMLKTIPRDSLLSILVTTAALRQVEDNLNPSVIFFSTRFKVDLISEFLEFYEVFSLIVAFTNVKIPETMIGLH